MLKKAFEQNLTQLLLSVDRQAHVQKKHLRSVDLFIELMPTEEDLDFSNPASAMNGTSSLSPDVADQEHTMKPIFDKVFETIPAPVDNSDEPLQFQVAMLDYNDFVGRIGIGRVKRGTIKMGDNVDVLKLDGTTQSFRVTKLAGFIGLDQVEIEEAKAGDLIAVSGMEDISVGETVADPAHPEALPILRIDEPTLQMTFRQNDSPFAGREGKFVTARQIEDRLRRELHTDVSLRVEDTDQAGAWLVLVITLLNLD